MGTPDFAVPALESLIVHGYNLCGVFTQPDRPKGRGHKLQPPPVKELALRQGLEVYQPETLRDTEIQKKIIQMEPDVIAVVAYGKLLPPEILEIPHLGCINVHGSLLPKYRGAAPIQWTIINGESTAGVTTQFMAEGMDTGDILLKAEVPVGREETTGELFDRLKILGAKLLIETLDGLELGSIQRTPQNHDQATLAPKLQKEMSVVDWTQPALKIHDLIRGLNPWPCATTVLGGKRMKLLSSRIVEGEGREPGTVYVKNGEMIVACGQQALRIVELQTENGKRMGGREYLVGHPLEAGARFV